MDPDEYCRERALAPGSTGYYATLFLAPAARRAVAAVLAFRRELDDACRKASEPALARQRLAWWREELVRARAGTAQHPVARALPIAGAPAAGEVELGLLVALVEAAARDAASPAYASLEQLEEHCRRVGGGTWELAALAGGASRTSARPAARRLGTGIEMTDLIWDSLAPGARGKVYLPADELARRGLDLRALRERPGDESSRALVRALVARARDAVDSGLALLPAVERGEQLAGVIAGEVARHRLGRIERRGWRLPERPGGATPLTKLWLAWRARARARRGRA